MQQIPADWVKVHLLIVHKHPKSCDIGDFFVFYQSPKGEYFQEPDYIDYIIQRLGFGRLYLSKDGETQRIDFVDVTVGGQDWVILNYVWPE